MASQGFGSVLLEARLGLLDDVVAQMEGEKDPRCLLAAFRAMHTTLQLYGAHRPQVRFLSMSAWLVDFFLAHFFRQE